MINVASFGWPQWVILAWLAFGMIAAASKNGKEVVIRAPVQIVVTLITLIVLACGGFFG